MPIYQFLCEKCDYREETRTPVSERNKIRICPKCTNALTRLMGTVSGFILKGAGFFRNDYPKTG